MHTLIQTGLHELSTAGTVKAKALLKSPSQVQALMLPYLLIKNSKIVTKKGGTKINSTITMSGNNPIVIMYKK